MHPPAARRFAALWAFLVLAATLTPAPAGIASAAATPWWCLACGPTGAADVIQNLILVAPVGFLLRVAGWRLRQVAVLAVVFPLSIELAQAFIPGRDGSLSDVVTNAAGTLLGWLAVTWTARLRALTSRASAGVAGLVVIGFATTMAGAIALLRPALHRAEYTRARIAPEIVGRPRFGGEVIRFAVNGRVYRDREVPSALPRGDVTVEAAVQWHGPTTGTATIARIDGDAGSAVVSVDQRHESFGVDVYSAASAWRLRSPTVGVAAPLPLAAGDTVVIRFAWRGDSIALTATHGTVTTSTGARLRPWHAWILLNPFTGRVRFDAVFAMWTALWVGSWLLAVGWCLTRSEKREARSEN